MWLFPGGIGDIYNETIGGLDQLSGPIKLMKTWENHLMHYYDGRFQQNQMFTLYVFNKI